MNESARRASTIDSHVGMRIRLQRKLLGVSQTVLGSAIGVSFQQLQKYERGTNRVSAAALWLISQQLQAPIGYFFEGLSRKDINEATPDHAMLQLVQSADGVDFAEVLAKMTDPQIRKDALAYLRTLRNRAAA
jgi:transcriptional regulator with XRE-family HTH domain